MPAPELMSFFLGIGGRTFLCPIIDSKAATRGPFLSLDVDAIVQCDCSVLDSINPKLFNS